VYEILTSRIQGRQVVGAMPRSRGKVRTSDLAEAGARSRALDSALADVYKYGIATGLGFLRDLRVPVVQALS